MTIVCPPELRNIYRDGRLLPFIGAGSSMSVQWSDSGIAKRGPSWKEMVDQAARILGFGDPDLLRVRGTDLQILEYFKTVETTAKLTNWLQNNMRPPDDALEASQIHSELARLSNCSIFYTTNYDAFIERSFNLNKRDCIIVADEAGMGKRSGSAEIVKFHGDFDHPDNMVLSESDYEKRLKFETPMDYRLRSDILGRSLLFIGYSFNDWNVSYLFRLVNEHLGELPVSFSGKRAYIIIANPSDFERLLFKTRKIEVIPSYGSDLAADIAALLRELRS